MTRITSPAPQFTSLTKTEVMAALDDPETPGNPVAVEVSRLIEGYTENFSAHVERRGRSKLPPPELFASYFRPVIRNVTPQTAIEAVAMDLTMQAILRAYPSERWVARV